MGDFSTKFGARKEGESRADNLEGQIKLEMKCQLFSQAETK